MAAKGQPQNLLWAQKLKNLRSEIIQILHSHALPIIWKCAGDFTEI